jgi:hypothetical protein
MISFSYTLVSTRCGMFYGAQWAALSLLRTSRDCILVLTGRRNVSLWLQQATETFAASWQVFQVD